MMTSRSIGRLMSISIMIVAAVFLSVGSTIGSTADFVQQSLGDRAVVRAKAEQPLKVRTQLVSNGLNNPAPDTIRVWVFFTDKGVTNQSEFNRKAAQVTLTQRAMVRRAKVGRDHVVFADLPVVTSYVEQVVELGATHRRSSRWLNAATFSVPVDKLEAVAGLPFVAEVRPMATYKSQLPTPEDIKYQAPKGAQSPDALSYGVATAQLTQIDVPAVHELGYAGDGVTLAILDTGFRKTHAAFAQHYANNRVLAEYDFINNDTNTANDTANGDVSSQWSHGTYIWSVSAGEDPGNMYGPAYHSNIILCKTEDVRSETEVEEDNWVRALEFADSVGTDVITCSLGYSTFDDGSGYTYQDMDGQTAVITVAASTCDGLGIVLCNSMGNDGPSSGTLTAPADAFDILAVGSVTSTGVISSFSSRGPTFDGRTKPEVCARGSGTACAGSWDDVSYTAANGTSLSTPLVAGVACLVIEAHPDWTPAEVREAMKMTASQASTPDNNYGWGVVDALAAINYHVDTSCCIGAVGNIDGSASETPDLADLSAMINHLFINLEPIPCPAEGDLDLSGQPDPTQADITLGDLSVLIDNLFITLDPLPACP